jgi:signal transduction histidine kinase/ligand-binding sensor domain-containing protein
LLTNVGYTQSYTEQGSPFIKNYTTKEMNGGGPQIWCWAQDNRGMVYVGDMDGIIEFNGKDWKRIPNANNSIVRSMDVDSLGVIYAGASNDFGYLQPDERGEMKYISLAQHVIDKGIKFLDIWKVISTSSGIYYFSNKYVFKYNKKKIVVIPADFMVQDAYLLNNHLYLPTKKGLCLLNDSILTERTPASFFLMAPMGENEALTIAGHTGELVVFNLLTSGINKFETPAQRFFVNNPICEIVGIDKNKLAIVTRTNKILILSDKGEIIQYIDKESGLLNGTIYKTFVDNDKNLWICTSKGISKVDINYPVLKFGENHNINNNVMTSCLFNGKRYIGTIDGIYYLSRFDVDKAEESQKFIKIKANTNECWNFMVVEHQLYAISSSGLWLINGTDAKHIYSVEAPQKAHCFGTSPLFPNVFFIGMRGKLLALKLNGSHDINQLKVVEEMDFDGITEKIRRITSDKDGNLWLNTQYNGVYFVRFIDGNIKNYRITLLGKQNGLLSLNGTRTYKVNNEITIATESGLLHPTFPSGKNAPDSLIRFEYNMLFGDTIKDPYAIVTPISENKYLIASNGMYYATVHGSKHAYDTCGFSRLSCSIESICVGGDSIISLCSTDGLFNYNIKNHRNFKKPFNTVISKVEINNDSTIFGGCFYNRFDSTKVASLTQTPEFVPSISYKFNSLTIHYAGLFYEDPEVTEFQHQLVGFDEKYSNWSTDNKSVYTNLPNGKYTFRVKARNAYWIESNVAEYQFTIMAPWYKAWWAYLAYVSLFSGIIYLIIILYTRRLNLQKKYLEEVIEDRTWSIIEQANELKTINEKLVEMDKFKQGVTSMIVHDLKNPINAIINSGNSHPEDQLNRIKQTGRQMLNLVLNILDVYKYQETKISLTLSNQNLLDVSCKAIDQILFLSNEKNITISNHINPQLVIRADSEMIERVFVNILTNAIKYTHNNGHIELEAEQEEQESVDRFIKISITDNGLGIPADKIHLVFQKFGQVIAKKSGSVRSTGLGLTYCKMVVEAHGGEINVESEPDKGSTFWFTLPGMCNDQKIGQTAVPGGTSGIHSIELSLETRQLIGQFLIELQQTEIYKISELTNILEKIDDSTNHEIRIWKQHLIRAIDSGNELLYKNLINQ